MFFLVGINVFTVAVKVGEKQKDIVDGSIFFKKKKKEGIFWINCLFGASFHYLSRSRFGVWTVHILRGMGKINGGLSVL